MSDPTNVKLRVNNSELWGGLIGLALGGFVVWSGLKLKLGTINDPGSGYVLFYTGLLMCLFAATIIVAAVTEGGPTFGSRWENTRWTKPLIGHRMPCRVFAGPRPARISALRDPADVAA